jgi:hypothetical protein
LLVYIHINPSALYVKRLFPNLFIHVTRIVDFRYRGAVSRLIRYDLKRGYLLGTCTFATILVNF